MRIKILVALVVLLLLPAFAAQDRNLPEGFTYLKDVAPEIVQDIRYFGSHNFLGRPVAGYEAPECILTQKAASALKAVNDELKPMGLKLMVFDGYRPARAVADFVAWSKIASDQKTKAEFYPNVDKKDFFKLGYVAEKSGHSRGSTADVTIVPLSLERPTPLKPDAPLKPCTAPIDKRFQDGSLDMGTGFDCMDELSHPMTGQVAPEAKKNRMLLRELMQKHGFKPLEEEWWHFTLKDEPFPGTYFDFPVTASGR